MAAIEITDEVVPSTASEKSNDEAEGDSYRTVAETAHCLNEGTIGGKSQRDASDESTPSSEKANDTTVLPTVVHKSAPIQIKICNTPPSSPTESSSGVEKRACRICQSESGVMVRPCACTGTMGDIHESCLNEWLSRSNNNEVCEICHQKYSKSGNVLQPIWKWRKPNIEMTNVIEMASVICLSLCLWYMLALTRERQFIERVFYAGIPPRSPDVARICKHILVTLLIVATLAGGLLNIVTRIYRYINKQRAIHFIDSQPNKKR
ncbi:E3 ubiquitin-protein ligase MARCH3 [Toxocara canis]|uniref:E3 ubiquitin-protein ligase MARCH3 n=1 Tax=Toxocara canis TaxID=6265 RepID=A0A0B2UNQ1_TOXCA|nr:E3 ubiquitin-protein ligase MARCH3 [Toxocara canis]